jgi:uncharacterized protein (TIGR03032 family)
VTPPNDAALDRLWGEHDRRWRDPSAALAAWDGVEVDPALLMSRAGGGFWDVLERLRLTVLVTREYEHLLLAISVPDGRPRVSYLPLPHPSGLAVDREARTVSVASTRNPNQIFELAPAGRPLPRSDVRPPPMADRPLMPIASTVHPGAMYIHDLARIGGVLYANSVGQNAVAEIGEAGEYRLAWWPRCVERRGRPVIDRNYIQLNSIANADSLEQSYFTASTDRMSARRPGHLNFPVVRRGVMFSGATREVVARGLTRPHSARVHEGRVYVDDSGYGRLVVADGDGGVETVTSLPGWTRGLCIHPRGVAFVGTSRVIPRYSHYAPGLTPERSRCALHAVELSTGRLLGSLIWPNANQIFAIDWIPRSWSAGLPFHGSTRNRTADIFYTYRATRRADKK